MNGHMMSPLARGPEPFTTTQARASTLYAQVPATLRHDFWGGAQPRYVVWSVSSSWVKVQAVGSLR
jgi:hypothetical protein